MRPHRIVGMIAGEGSHRRPVVVGACRPVLRGRTAAPHDGGAAGRDRVDHVGRGEIVLRPQPEASEGAGDGSMRQAPSPRSSNPPGAANRDAQAASALHPPLFQPGPTQITRSWSPRGGERGDIGEPPVDPTVGRRPGPATRSTISSSAASEIGPQVEDVACAIAERHCRSASLTCRERCRCALDRCAARPPSRRRALRTVARGSRAAWRT